MAFDGNGTFARIMNWVQDAATLIPIKADRHDQQDDDFAAGLTNCLTKDGQTSPTANIPMNGHRITNIADPINPQDVASKAYADTPHPSATGLTISGADVNGRLNFTSATGANGLAWTGADLSWLARLATAAGPGTPPVPPATLNRLVLNDKPDGSGTDVVTLNDTGTIVATGAITGTPMCAAKAASGNVHYWWYGPTNQDRMVMYTDSATYGHGYLRINGDDPATGAKKPVFIFQNNGTFASPGNINAAGAIYSNQNYSSVTANMVIAWQGGTLFFRPAGESNGTNSITFDSAGSIYSPNAITCAGAMTNGGSYVSNNVNVILATTGAGTCYLRPNGVGNGTNQVFVPSSGIVNANGVQTKIGLTGAYGGNSYTIYYTGSSSQLRIDDTYMGNFQFTCDYRIKANVKALGSVWEGIKKLRPISYTQKAHGIFKRSDEVLWGLVAHEAQAALYPGVANGEKDGEDMQALNLIPLITALAKGLQEAMLRIEALEART